MANLFLELLDIDKTKESIANCPKDEVVILIPHYSINVQSVYANCPDPEQIDWDWNDLEELLDCTLMVNDYDDLIADPHGIMY